MGWICSPSADNCILTFYSIADDLQVLNESVFSYLMALAPGVWITVFVMFIISFAVALLLSVRAIMVMT